MNRCKCGNACETNRSIAMVLGMALRSSQRAGRMGVPYDLDGAVARAVRLLSGECEQCVYGQRKQDVAEGVLR